VLDEFLVDDVRAEESIDFGTRPTSLFVKFAEILFTTIAGSRGRRTIFVVESAVFLEEI